MTHDTIPTPQPTEPAPHWSDSSGRLRFWPSAAQPIQVCLPSRLATTSNGFETLKRFRDMQDGWQS